jgi:excisionase family DNA binding protein
MRLQNEVVTHLKAQGPKLLTSRQAANTLGIHLETLYRWIAKGHIQYTRVGGRVKFAPSHLINYLESRSA